jgi:hypothetical protein
MKMNQNQMSEEDVKKTPQATESIVEQCLKLAEQWIWSTNKAELYIILTYSRCLDKVLTIVKYIW